MLQKGQPQGPTLPHSTTLAPTYRYVRARLALALYDLRVIWACMKKEIQSALTQRIGTILGVLLPVNFLILMSLFALSGAQAPTAVVMQDRGPYARAFYDAMAHAHSFRLQTASAQEAQDLLQAGKIVAVVTIPADFDTRVRQNQRVSVDVQINNLNTDFTNDIRRAVPDVITQFYQAQGSQNPIKVTLHEQDLRSRDVSQFQYNVVPMLVMLLLVSGLLNSSTAAAREWETRTIKELLLAPVARPAIIIGKVLAGFIATLLLGFLVFGLSAALDWTRPAGWQWVPSLGVLALVALLGTGLGVAFGAAVQRLVAAIPFSTLVAFYLFFLAGGIGILAFEPSWLQNIAAYNPLAYGVHALSQAVFYRTSDALGRDMLVLSLSAVVAVVLGVLALRRGIAS